MEQCPECNGTLVTDGVTEETFCKKCGYVLPKKLVESKFQEKDDVRSTDEETGKSISQHAPKDVGDYGGTGMSATDASGRPVNRNLWGRLRQHNNQTLSPFEKMLKDHKTKFNELTIRIIGKAYRDSYLDSRSLWPLYERCLRVRLQRGRDAELIMIGVICINRNNEGIPWRGEGTFWEHVTRVTGRKKREVLSVMNVITRTLDWEIDYFFPEPGKEKSYNEIYTIINEIKEDNNSFRSRKIWKRAVEILDKASGKGLTAGISPKNQAGAAIFLAGYTEDPPIDLAVVAAYSGGKKGKIKLIVKKFNTVLCSQCKSSKSLKDCPHIDNL